MQAFSRWPLDGRIAFIVCVIALICLLGARLADRPATHRARREGDFFRMRPLPSHAVTGIGLILAIVLITYGVSQARAHSPNQSTGMLVAAAFWICGLYFLYANYVDSQVLHMQAPLLPAYDANILRQLVGKTGLVNLHQADEEHHPNLISSRVGTIETVAAEVVTIRFEDGTRLTACGNLRSIRPGNRKAGWIASWYVDSACIKQSQPS